jgi:hypothetical protein
MSNLQCLCVLNRKRACEACILLAERESAYESNVDPLYRDKASALETEDWAWEVHGDPRSGDGDTLPDYC